jgi:glycosyltransferase involved in cell wall biosynthesis
MDMSRALGAGHVPGPGSVRHVRILLWHGYLLGGTGSNVYTRALAREWSKTGHDVTVLCQEPHPERYDVGPAEVVRPEIGGLLPVFVLDDYEGVEARLLQDLTPAELERYVESNAAALRERLPADAVFTNHVLLGGPVGAATGVPFAVKAHGSELEYSMRGRPELQRWGAETLAAARATFVGSQHIRTVLEDVVGHVDNVYEVPPGVDVDDWIPRDREPALRGLLEEARRDPPNPGSADERLPDEGNPERLAAFFADDAPTVLYFGKLIRNKGVHVLLEALREVEARAVIVGFGDYRAELEALAPQGTLFTGALEHRHLVHLLPLADVAVVPSIFPEAFGMVAAEAASAGVPPLVARHSGLAEVAAGIEAEYPPELAQLVSFESGDAVDLAGRLRELLELPAELRSALGLAARRAVERNWSWARIGERLLEPFA